MAERGGFEPPVEVSPYDGLANSCFRPLSHLSGDETVFKSIVPYGRHLGMWRHLWSLVNGVGMGVRMGRWRKPNPTPNRPRPNRLIRSKLRSTSLKKWSRN